MFIPYQHFCLVPEYIMTWQIQYGLMEAAGLRPGPNVSLAYAIDKFRREKTRELILYMAFLAIFTASSLLQRDVNSAHLYASEVRNTILKRPLSLNNFYKGFSDVSTEQDVWTYMTSVIPSYLYEEAGSLNFVLRVNTIIQAPRLRQVRVNAMSKDECRIAKRLYKVMDECFPYFSVDHVNKTSIPGWPRGSRIPYRTAKELQTEWYGMGILAYDGGGFSLDIPLNFTRADTVDMMTYLRSIKWTDRHTRALFFDFALYNPSQRFFLSARLLFEFLP
jgi:hypothetical protein